MRVLVTGRGGNSGSWKVRGEQLGKAIRATVVPNASREDILNHDIVVVVKRSTPQLSNILLHSGKTVVWDTVDWYPQPNNWNPNQLICETLEYARKLGAHHIIAATQKMAIDLDTPFWLPHHGWERGIAPVRPELKVIAYEGSHRYIDDFVPHVDTACKAIGAKFVINPQNYLDADVILALRTPRWSNYASRNWKSCVKLSNSIVAGIPFIGHAEEGYLERYTGQELFLSELQDLEGYLRWLKPQNRRQRIQSLILQHAQSHSLDTIAQQYLDLLRYFWISQHPTAAL